MDGTIHLNGVSANGSKVSNPQGVYSWTGHKTPPSDSGGSMWKIKLFKFYNLLSHYYMWSRQPYHIGLRIQENTWFTCFFLSAGRRRPNMIGSIFLKKEKFSSSYPGVSNFSTNQNPAFYRCFQILGLGWGCKETGEVQARCVVLFFVAVSLCFARKQCLRQQNYKILW